MNWIMKWLVRLVDIKPFFSTNDRLAALETSLKDMQTQKKVLEDELNVFRTQQEKDKERYDSTEPWVEIRSADFNEVKGIRIELDWNDAFVQHLKESGIKGKSDDEIVQKWLALLYQDLIEKLETQVIDENSKKRVSDYA